MGVSLHCLQWSSSITYTHITLPSLCKQSEKSDGKVKKVKKKSELMREGIVAFGSSTF
jgi:hypothetical protein